MTFSMNILQLGEGLAQNSVMFLFLLDESILINKMVWCDLKCIISGDLDLPGSSHWNVFLRTIVQSLKKNTFPEFYSKYTSPVCGAVTMPQEQTERGNKAWFTFCIQQEKRVTVWAVSTQTCKVNFSKLFHSNTLKKHCCAGKMFLCGHPVFCEYYEHSTGHCPRKTNPVIVH